MARIDNAIVMQCDRCGKTGWYTREEDPAGMKDWWNTRRLNAQNEFENHLLCANCFGEWTNKMKDFDNAMDSWTQNGGKQNG